MNGMKVTYNKGDHFGSDLTVVDRARASFGKLSKWADAEAKTLSDADENLIAYLARGCPRREWDLMVRDACSSMDPNNIQKLFYKVKNMPTHWAPFAHPHISLHFKVPIFVARQLFKSKVGFIESEISRRYIKTSPELYVPTEGWRQAAENVKQGSSDKFVDDWDVEKSDGIDEQPYTLNVDHWLKNHNTSQIDLYNMMINDVEVCPEQARMILSQSMFTEYWSTGSLYGWANVYNQRSDPHAQRESSYVAEMIREIVEPLFPVSWRELTRKQ